jgi:hypothetical protein
MALTAEELVAVLHADGDRVPFEISYRSVAHVLSALQVDVDDSTNTVSVRGITDYGALVHPVVVLRSARVFDCRAMTAAGMVERDRLIQWSQLMGGAPGSQPASWAGYWGIIDPAIDDAPPAPKPKKVIPEVCPTCGDVGEWRMLALVCRKGHGKFQG